MLAAAATRPMQFRSHMATESRPRAPQNSIDAVARAIEALRTRAGITQQDAADQMGVTRQAWQHYEAGARQAVLRSDMQERLAEALGVERADLLREMDRQAGRATTEARPAPEPAKVYELPVLGRVRASPAGPQIYDIQEPESFFDVAWMFSSNTRTLRVAGDSMTGYVESGQIVIYDVSQWPRRGDGCVVELNNGEVYVKEYLESAQGVLKVRQRFPEETISFPMADVKGVYLIRMRGG